MRKSLYYHIYLRWDVDPWLNMFFEQMKCIEDAGLLDEFDAFNFVAINRQENTLAKKYLIDAVRSYVPESKFHIDFPENPFFTDEEMMASLDSPNLVSENFTMRKIYNHALAAPESQLICYIHQKGITRTIKYNSIDIESVKRYHYWRQYLNWGVIENWKRCVEVIEKENCDVAGINFNFDPLPHYSGNFWWASTSHIKLLPDPKTVTWFHELQKNSTNHWLRNVASDRYRDEQWLCAREGTRVYNLADLDQSRNPAAQLLKRKEYGEVNR